jgi:hypothetical protein
MEYKKKLETTKTWFTIYEHEDENGLTGKVEFAIGKNKDIDDAFCILTKQELFQVIGTLLHVQAKMNKN